MDRVVSTDTSAKEVAEVLEAMLPIVTKFDEAAVLKACITLVILMQDPHINVAKLIDMIKDTSNFIAMRILSDNLGTVQ